MSALTVHIDPYAHSGDSYDAHDSAEFILGQATETGLGVIAVTGHDVIDELLQAAQLVPMYGLVGILGVEVSAADGHLLALGVGEPPPRRRPLNETAHWVRERGGVAIVPHLFQRNRHGIGRRRLGWYHDAAGGDAFGTIRTYSSWLFTGYKNRRAHRFAAKCQYPGVAGNDAHRVGYVGRAYTEVDIPDVSCASLTVDDILIVIRSSLTEVQGRRTPIPTNTKRYAGVVGRESAYYTGRGALGNAFLVRRGTFRSGYYAKLGALKNGPLAKAGVT